MIGYLYRRILDFLIIFILDIHTIDLYINNAKNRRRRKTSPNAIFWPVIPMGNKLHHKTLEDGLSLRDF